jgi:hypothetical protein
MIRKFVLAAAAIAALGTASLTVTATPAAAKGGGWHHHHHGFHGGFRGYRVYSGYDSCLRTRWVVNRFGNLVPRTVNVCSYY